MQFRRPWKVPIPPRAVNKTGQHDICIPSFEVKRTPGSLEARYAKPYLEQTSHRTTRWKAWWHDGTHEGRWSGCFSCAKQRKSGQRDEELAILLKTLESHKHTGAFLASTSDKMALQIQYLQYPAAQWTLTHSTASRFLPSGNTQHRIYIRFFHWHYLQYTTLLVDLSARRMSLARELHLK